MSAAGSDAPDRILVRLPTWVGDAVMATPALRALRAAYPRAEIAVEGRPVLEDLLRGHPAVDRFVADGRRGASGLVARARELRTGRFDLAVLLPDSPRAALGPFLAGIPRRVGYARDPLRRALLTDVLVPEMRAGRRVPVPNEERYLRLTRHLGCPDRGGQLDLVVDPAARKRVDERLAGQGIGPDAPLAVVTPGAAFGPSKLWPPPYFATACDGLVRRLGLVPVIAPAPDEIPIADAIEAGARERVLVDPPGSLAELVALVSRARIVLTNDTGPRHVAVALSVPAVVLMGPTDPAITAGNPGGQRVLREPVDCSPCQLERCPIDHRCMTRLTPRRALDAAEELLGMPGGNALAL